MSPISSTLPVVESELTILRLETVSDPEPEVPGKVEIAVGDEEGRNPEEFT
jgi:hypothetical protein